MNSSNEGHCDYMVLSTVWMELNVIHIHDPSILIAAA